MMKTINQDRHSMKHSDKIRHQMKTGIYVFSFLSFILLPSSCKKEIVSKDIYGVWEMQVQTTTEGPQFAKLLLEKDHYSWIDPVVSDTIYFFEKVEVNGDTLLLTDGFNHPTLCIIKELHDSVLTLSHVAGFDKEITYKKVLDYNEGPFKLEEVKASVFSKDSLDVIVKSFLVWDYYQNNEDAKTYHSLTKDEMLQARELLRRYMTDGSLEKDQYNNEDAYPFDQYIRQYESYTEKGHLYVRVTLNTDICIDKGWGYTVLKRDIYDVDDGGPSHAQATIDLTTQKVVDFVTNGYA
ncbi:MAG: hypothetical protein J5529_09030 [Prevotella sp.]|nr:hypothetical protein [Prevotella sp.]